MPLLETKGNASAQAYGLTTSRPAANFIEDVFSTWLYTGNGGTQNIFNGINLAPGATSPGWIATLGGSGSNSGRAVAVDNLGNVYVCGNTVLSGNTDIQLVKYNSTGIIQWQRSVGSTGVDNGWGLSTDSSGNVYICGSVFSSNDEFLIIKYDSSGNIQWQQNLNSVGSDVAYSVTVDIFNNVYVCGRTNLAGVFDVLLAKYDSNGVLQWQRRLTDSGNVIQKQGYGITTDNLGNVYLCGYYDSTGSNDALIVKYNSNGSILWQRILGAASSTQEFYSIAADSSGNVYACGFLDSLGSANDIAIAKYNSAGNLQWQNRLSSADSDIAYSVVASNSGNIYVCGFTTQSSISNILIAKYDFSGALQWQRTLSSSSAMEGRGITVDSFDNIYIGGRIGISGNNYFVAAKLPGDGSGTGAYVLGAATISYQVSNLTNSSTSFVSSSVSLSNVVSTLTSSAGSLTNTTSSLTSNVTDLPLGPGFGGLVWMKGRTTTANHALYDTARGATFDLASNLTGAQTTQSTGLTGFLANGFSIGSLAKINTNAATYASWTFREQPRFFDVVTYTGNGANRTIAHSLGSVPGCIMVKRLDASGDWQVYHRSLANTQYMVLNSTAAAATGATRWNSTTPTATEFSLGTDATVNANGGTYVAYLFAHNAGGFGATGADNAISCGSFTPNGSGNATITLGFEPQWLLMKNSTSVNDWFLFDTMRGFSLTSQKFMFANLTTIEANFSDVFTPTATGFTANAVWAGLTTVYIAIRRGPMRTPTTGTSVFGLNARTGTGANATVTGGQTDDAVLIKNRGDAFGAIFSSRLTANGGLRTNSSTSEVAENTTVFQANPWDVMDGVKVGTTSAVTNASGNTFINYLFRRAPGFFDVVCYTGTGANTTQTHNLGVVPELMIVKSRSNTAAWQVYSSALANSEYLVLNTAAAKTTGATRWNSTTPTASVFSLGTASEVNISAATYIAYLFASCPGVSKVGSYTGTGATQTINCGFSSGARFVLIKRTDASGNWYVWDSARGIVAGNDPYLLLNSFDAEVTTTDWVDTAASGFEISDAGGNLVNTNGASYIFLSIA